MLRRSRCIQIFFNSILLMECHYFLPPEFLRLSRFFRSDAWTVGVFIVDPMLLPLGNPIECHEEVLYLQPMVPPKRFDIPFPSLGDAQKV